MCVVIHRHKHSHTDFFDFVAWSCIIDANQCSSNAHRKKFDATLIERGCCFAKR